MWESPSSMVETVNEVRAYVADIYVYLLHGEKYHLKAPALDRGESAEDTGDIGLQILSPGMNITYQEAPPQQYAVKHKANGRLDFIDADLPLEMQNPVIAAQAADPVVRLFRGRTYPLVQKVKTGGRPLDQRSILLNDPHYRATCKQKSVSLQQEMEEIEEEEEEQGKDLEAFLDWHERYG